MSKIWIIDDEENIRDFLQRGLGDCGYDTEAFADGVATWEAIESGGQLPDLMLIDIRMPKMDGLELCRRLRARLGYALPVIMLTALGTTDDIVDGLHAGADDYVVKPFKFAEVLARIESALRRQNAPDSGNFVIYNDLRIDVKAHKAYRQNVESDLSIKEMRLLLYLVENQGKMLSRSQLLHDVWDKDFDTNTNIVDVYIRYLRGKIDDNFSPKLIHTVVNVGYMFQ